MKQELAFRQMHCENGALTKSTRYGGVWPGMAPRKTKEGGTFYIVRSRVQRLSKEETGILALFQKRREDQDASRQKPKVHTPDSFEESSSEQDLKQVSFFRDSPEMNLTIFETPAKVR